MSVTTTTFHPAAGGIERLARKAYGATMRGLGIVPFPVLAQGARFWVDTVDYIDQCLAFDGMWEAPQLEELAAVCKARRIDCFLDVGANAGFYSIMFAIKDLTERIVAFEPDPGNYARLIANLGANGLRERVDARPVALGDQAGEVLLYEGAKWNRGESTIAEPDQTPKEFVHRVRQVRFDDEFSFAGQSLVIKMDVEGYEFNVIAGMERTLKDNACYLQVELYSNRLEELKSLFDRLGYRFLHTEYIDHFFTNMPGIG
jgi:FkbM family methyltransferase